MSNCFISHKIYGRSDLVLSSDVSGNIFDKYLMSYLKGCSRDLHRTAHNLSYKTAISDLMKICLAFLVSLRKDGQTNREACREQHLSC